MAKHRKLWKPAGTPATRDWGRRCAAERWGYAPPPPERDCPPLPTDFLCQACRKPAGRYRPFYLHHNHETGEFIAWTCARCNARLSVYLGDFGEPAKRGPMPESVKAKISESNRATRANKTKPPA